MDFSQDVLELKPGELSSSYQIEKPTKQPLSNGYESLKDAITIVESEVANTDSELESLAAGSDSNPDDAPTCDHIIAKAFEASKSQWIDDPIISQWRNPSHRIHGVLSEVNDLYNTWRQGPSRPFSPSSDPLWLHTGRVLAQVGLPWHNNQINMPNEIDTSWPFHFKSYETEVLQAKGARVGDPNPSGYICSPGEASCYCIRALQQELRVRFPARKPVLVYDRFDLKMVELVKQLFGLEPVRVDLSQGTEATLRRLKRAAPDSLRPIVFAATSASAEGGCDDMDLICELSESTPLLLHVDAPRNFDYITTLAESERTRLGVAKLTLGIPSLETSIRSPDGSIVASTVVAGNSALAPSAALKPAALGEQQARVAYIRASDSTLAGSRDAISPLWLALQEARLGPSGFSDVYRHCAGVRATLLRLLESRGVPAFGPPHSLDIILKHPTAAAKQDLVAMGGALIVDGDDGDVVLTIQPGLKPDDIEAVIAILSHEPYDQHNDIALYSDRDFTDLYPVSARVVEDLRTTVQAWKVATRSAAGYPFHMGSYSALGPVVGRFLDLDIPQSWTQVRTDELLTARLSAFGLSSPQGRASFRGSFTNGSTMGNRVGIHAALARLPDAYVYFSAESHYSVAKTLRDCDTLTNRWSGRECRPRYSRIPCDGNGSINVALLTERALADRRACLRLGGEYHMILFANMGTTFVGARDDLKGIRQALKAVGIDISYIHVDGALDFGFGNCDVKLGPPGSTVTGDLDMPLVQGVTLSHHKALGNMVSGEVLCFSPEDQLASLTTAVDPRIVFESWLYHRVYAADDLAVLMGYCRKSAARLETALRGVGVVTKRNPGSIIVVLERPPAWIIEEFSLRPEGDWVHFITMPHISPQTIDFFVDRITSIERQSAVAFSYVAPLFSAVMRRDVKLCRLQCRGALGRRVTELAESLVPLDGDDSGDLTSITKTSLRGALTVAILDEGGQLEAVILAESQRDMSIRAGPVLIGPGYAGSAEAVVEIARQLIGCMGRHLNANVQADRASFTIYQYLDGHSRHE